MKLHTADGPLGTTEIRNENRNALVATCNRYYDAAEIVAAVNNAEALANVLTNYFEMFDDESLSDLGMKRWLDSNWISDARAALAAFRKEAK